MDEKSIAGQLTHEAKSIMADKDLTGSEKIIVAVHAGYSYGVDHGVQLSQKKAWSQGYEKGYAAAERNCGAAMYKEPMGCDDEQPRERSGC